jgi:hypothetical protein
MNAPDLATLTFDEHGLVVAVAQDAATGTVLMVAYMNREALARTVESGEAHFWSRSRQALWHKGATAMPTHSSSQFMPTGRHATQGSARVLRSQPRSSTSSMRPCTTGRRDDRRDHTPQNSSMAGGRRSSAKSEKNRSRSCSPARKKATKR